MILMLTSWLDPGNDIAGFLRSSIDENGFSQVEVLFQLLVRIVIGALLLGATAVVATYLWPPVRRRN
jgi:hypothetical protein